MTGDVVQLTAVAVVEAGRPGSGDVGVLAWYANPGRRPGYCLIVTWADGHDDEAVLEGQDPDRRYLDAPPAAFDGRAVGDRLGEIRDSGADQHPIGLFLVSTDEARIRDVVLAYADAIARLS